MRVVRPLSPWRTFFFGLAMGPVYLFEIRDTFEGPIWVSFLLPMLMLLCVSVLALGLYYPPLWISIAYLVLWAGFLALVQLIHWVSEKKYEIKKAANKRWSLSRSILALSYFTSLFQASGAMVLTLLYWALAQYVTVQIAPGLNVSFSWLMGGIILSFLYGARDKRFLDQDVNTHWIAFLFLHVLALGFGLLELALIHYPVDRLSPLHFPVWQSSIRNLYPVFFFGQFFSIYFFLSKLPLKGFAGTSLRFLVALPWLCLHFIQLSQHAPALYLTAANVFESQGDLQKARQMYAHAIPHVSGEAFNAALLHRQGVLHSIQGERKEALEIFKKVVADYSAEVDEYDKASEYVKSFEKSKEAQESDFKVLKLRYQTFEQAASCFPNSLGMILHYYEKEPVSTRELSYQIKEGFHDGTFIWKAQTYLETTSYRILTSYWQSIDRIKEFLDRKIPVLIYIPGHVFSVYGYDDSFQILLSYDTARANRWDDKPYKQFYQDWMESGFLMSVVLPEKEVQSFKKEFPQYVERGREYQILQKFDLSNYYVGKHRYLRDYEAIEDYKGSGAGAILLGARHKDVLLYDFLEKEAKEKVEELSLENLKNPWASKWGAFERISSWHLSKNNPQAAEEVINYYLDNLSREGLSLHSSLMLRRLSIADSLDKDEARKELATQMIGEAQKDEWDSSYWGHVILGRDYLKNQDYDKVEELLEPILHHLHPAASTHDPAFRAVLLLIRDLLCVNPEYFSTDKRFELEMSLIAHGVTNQCD